MIEQSEDSRYLLNAARAVSRYGRCTWVALSAREKTAVALALDRADWLEEFGYTLAEAIAEAGEEWVVIIPRIARELLDEGL